MSLRRTLAIARKEFRHILRDLRTFFLVTVSPAFLLLTLSYIFVMDLGQVSLAVWDLDRSGLSRQYVAALTADGDFRADLQVSSYDELEHLLLAGQVDGGLVIPPGFERDLRAGYQVQVQAVLDGVDAVSCRQTAYALEQRTAAFAAALCSSTPSGGLDLRAEAWYNPTLKSLISMVPGLVAVVLCMPALALALTLTREKETGSFEGLIVTPVRGLEYLLGKLVAYMASGAVSLLLVWFTAVFYFRVPFRGHFATYFALTSAFLLASMGFSLLIATFVRSQQAAMFLVLMVFFVPSFFVAGLISPVDPTSIFSQAVAHALPTSYLISASRGVFLKGLGLVDLLVPLATLCGLGLGSLLISLLLFRKRLG